VAVFCRAEGMVGPSEIIRTRLGEGREETGETGMEIFIGSTAPHPFTGHILIHASMHPSRSFRKYV
jgi:hypothetical protein